MRFLCLLAGGNTFDTAFPTKAERERILSVVGSSDGTGRYQIESAVNIRHGRLEKNLSFLLNESALVKQGKYSREMRFSDELVGKSARLLRDLAGEAGVTTVTCVPSLRSDLVLDFARRVAASAGLHFIELIRKSPARQQKEMENTAFQCRNAMNSFSVEAEQVPEKLILIDDIVDSRWTMTVCGHLLSERGCQAVYPFALADSSSREV